MEILILLSLLAIIANQVKLYLFTKKHFKQLHMENSELVTKLEGVTAIVEKVKTEIQALKDAIDSADDVPQSVQDAFANLEAAVKSADDMNEDAPNTPQG